MTANAAQIAADAYPPASRRVLPPPDATAAAKPPPPPLSSSFALSTAFTLWWCKRWWRARDAVPSRTSSSSSRCTASPTGGPPRRRTRAASSDPRDALCGVLADAPHAARAGDPPHPLARHRHVVRVRVRPVLRGDGHRVRHARVDAWSFAHMVHGGLLGPASVVGLVVGTLAFHFGYQLVISTLLHRYFSHRAFAASRPLNFVLALVAVAAGQRGPLWWASTHRRHHQLCDRDGDRTRRRRCRPAREAAVAPRPHPLDDAARELWHPPRPDRRLAAGSAQSAPHPAARNSLTDARLRAARARAAADRLFFLDASGYIDAGWGRVPRRRPPRGGGHRSRW